MKDKLLKALFIISFIPYVAIAGIIIYGTIFGSYSINGVEMGIPDKFLANIENAYWYGFMIPIIPTCFTIQMCYINRKKSGRLILCTLIPCAFVLIMGIIDAVVGIRFFSDSSLSYGLEGFQIGVIFGAYLYCIIYPIIPACILFQIGYVIYQIIQKKKNKEV